MAHSNADDLASLRAFFGVTATTPRAPSVDPRKADRARMARHEARHVILADFNDLACDFVSINRVPPVTVVTAPVDPDDLLELLSYPENGRVLAKILGFAEVAYANFGHSETSPGDIAALDKYASVWPYGFRPTWPAVVNTARANVERYFQAKEVAVALEKLTTMLLNVGTITGEESIGRALAHAHGVCHILPSCDWNENNELLRTFV